MILLTVKISADAFRKSPASPGEFDKAWFRLVNADTSQTLDYKLIKDVSSPDNASGTEDNGAGADDADEGGAAPSKGATYTYVAGRIFYDHQGTTGKWVYESYNHCFSSERFENGGIELAEELGAIYQRSEEEVIEQAEEIREARLKVTANEEDRKLAAAVNAAKKKAPSKNGAKKETAVEEEKKDAEVPKRPPVVKELNLLKTADFG